MSNLEIINGNKVLDSLEVAKMVDKRHDHLMRDIKGYIEILDRRSHSPKLGSESFFIPASYHSRGKEFDSFLITKQGCELIANKMIGEKGVMFTATYVSLFNDMEAKLATTSPAFALPTNFAEALRELASTWEREQVALVQLEVAKPKVEFYDAVMQSNDTLKMAEVAKVLNFKNVGRNTLFQILRSHKVLRVSNEPYQKYVDKGFFKITESVWTDSEYEEKITLVTVVTQKGLEFIRNLLLNNNFAESKGGK